MHKDVKRRIRAVAKETGHSENEMRDALVLLGLNMYYNLAKGQGIEPIPVKRAIAGALDRAKNGNAVDTEERLRESEEAAWMLARQIERETGCE
jgi:hypothetical protein